MTQRAALKLVIAATVFVFAVLLLVAAFVPETPPQSATAVAPAPSIPRQQPGVKEGVLTNGGSEVPLALTDAAFDELNAAASRRDLDGFKAVFFRGDALMIAEGTRAQQIGGWVSGRKVQILEGPFKGKSGWVAAEQFK